MMVAVAVLFAATLVAAKLSGSEYPLWFGAWVRLGSSMVAGGAVEVSRLLFRLLGDSSCGAGMYRTHHAPSKESKWWRHTRCLR